MCTDECDGRGATEMSRVRVAAVRKRNEQEGTEVGDGIRVWEEFLLGVLGIGYWGRVLLGVFFFCLNASTLDIMYSWLLYSVCQEYSCQETESHCRAYS